MTRRLFERMSQRELVLAAVTLQAVVAIIALTRWIRPAYDQWQGLRAQVQARSLEYQKLRGYLAVEELVAQRYRELSPQVFQEASDQITLSRFLQGVETAARQPNLTIVSMKPGAIEVGPMYRRFPIKLSVNGPLSEIVRFLTALCSGPQMVGIESFSLHGVQGGRVVDCRLSLWFVTLANLSPQHSSLSSASSPSRSEETAGAR